MMTARSYAAIGSKVMFAVGHGEEKAALSKGVNGNFRLGTAERPSGTVLKNSTGDSVSVFEQRCAKSAISAKRGRTAPYFVHFSDDGPAAGPQR
jgi:hypothetical protein